jgi:hypothetical protein
MRNTSSAGPAPAELGLRVARGVMKVCKRCGILTREAPGHALAILSEKQRSAIYIFRVLLDFGGLSAPELQNGSNT